MRQRPSAPALSWRQPLLRQLALWLGTLCALAQLSGAVHWLLVEHVRCASHGEWVHAGDDHAAPQSEAPGARSDDPAWTFTDSGDGDGHEHCAVGSERRKLAWLPASALGWSWTAAAAGCGSARAAALLSARLYSFAPKTSPPL